MRKKKGTTASCPSQLVKAPCFQRKNRGLLLLWKTEIRFAKLRNVISQPLRNSQRIGVQITAYTDPQTGRG